MLSPIQDLSVDKKPSVIPDTSVSVPKFKCCLGPNCMGYEHKFVWNYRMKHVSTCGVSSLKFPICHKHNRHLLKLNRGNKINVYGSNYTEALLTLQIQYYNMKSYEVDSDY